MHSNQLKFKLPLKSPSMHSSQLSARLTPQLHLHLLKPQHLSNLRSKVCWCYGMCLS